MDENLLDLLFGSTPVPFSEEEESESLFMLSQLCPVIRMQGHVRPFATTSRHLPLAILDNHSKIDCTPFYKCKGYTWQQKSNTFHVNTTRGTSWSRMKQTHSPKQPQNSQHNGRLSDINSNSANLTCIRGSAWTISSLPLQYLHAAAAFLSHSNLC